MINILIIDDSEIIRNLLYDFLSENGYGVVTASDGDEGIKKGILGDYDIIFCDVHMPKKNGYQVYMAISEVNPKATFIITDSLPDNLAEKTIQAGAYAILTKPFDLDEVRNTIIEIVNKNKVKTHGTDY